MKALSSMLLALALPVMLQAQVKFPAPSPACEIKQTIGLTDVKIEYSRPSARDRKVFGDVVPFGEMWRTGANASTKVSFSTDLKVGGMDVPAGTYALYTIPGQTEWTIILNKNLTYWGTPDKYDMAEELCRFTVKPGKLTEKVETFTILPSHLRDDKAYLSLLWENTVVNIPLELGTAAMVKKELDKALAGPDGRFYYQAARYYLDSNTELDKAMEYISIAVNEKKYDQFFVLRTMALIQAKKGDYKGAIATAKLSSEKAQTEGNMEYVRMNEASIQEWSAKL
jgi:hypothetical protein